MRRLFVLGLIVVSGWLFGLTGVQAGDWRQFRGNESNGLGDDVSLPTSFSATQNVAWKAALPGRGLSSPIVVGDRVFVTASSGFKDDHLHVLCFSATDGTKLWERQYTATGSTAHHPKSPVAAPTPASDGTRIFALYSSNDVVCLDLDGQLQWYRGLTYDYPNASNSLGMASSPIVIGNTLIAQVESASQSLATGINVATGVSRWTADRPRKENWTSTMIWPQRFGGDQDLALMQSSDGIAAVKPLTGEIVWNYAKKASSIPSSVVSEGVLYASSNGITALRPQSGSNQIEQLWQVGKLGPGTGSPLVYQGRLYSINNSGVLLAADLKTGEIRWQLRLPGPFSCSPVAAGGHLYVFNEKGEGHCVKLNDEGGELVSTGDMSGQVILCTPAVSNGALFVRSDQTLWKIAAK